MNSHAERVIAGITRAPPFMRRRTTSAALYAAMLPETATTIVGRGRDFVTVSSSNMSCGRACVEAAGGGMREIGRERDGTGGGAPAWDGPTGGGVEGDAFDGFACDGGGGGGG